LNTLSAKITGLLLIAILLLPVCSLSQERKTNWATSANGFVWCGSEFGLLKFDPSNETWSVEAGSPTNIKEILYYDNRLWMVGEGVASVNLTLGDWLYFDRSTGLPGDSCSALAFEEDYYWIATAEGAGRFDPVIEEWEVLPFLTASLKDVSTTNEFVFFIGDTDIYRFDKEYEKTVNTSSEYTKQIKKIHWVEELPGELWFIGFDVIDIYNVETRDWTILSLTEHLNGETIIQILSDGDRLWILTLGGLYWCNWKERNFQPFPRADKIKNFHIREIAGGGGNYYFATDRGILIYSEQEEKWELVDRTWGMENIDTRRLSIQGQILFIATEDGIEVYSIAERRFLPSLTYSKITTKTGKQRVHWDETGLSSEFLQSQFRLKGFYSNIEQWEEELWSYRNIAQLSPTIEQSGRRLAGYYDNTDWDEPLYGASYRGLREDNFRSLEYGNRLDYKLGMSELLGETTLEGAQGSIEAGERSVLRGRRQAKLDANFGSMVTASASDIFYGQGDAIYELSYNNLLPGSARVKINEEEIAKSDYTLSNTTGLLNLSFPGAELLDENDLIQVDYQYLLMDSAGGEFAGADLTLSQGDNYSEAVAILRNDSLQAGRFAGEIRVGNDAVGFRLLPEFALSNSRIYGQGKAEKLSVISSVENWRFSLEGRHQSENFKSLTPIIGEFGGLRQEYQSKIGYENKRYSVYTSGQMKICELGRENSYKIEGYRSLCDNSLSVFTKGAYRIADSDSLEREHREIVLGGNFKPLENILHALNFHRLELYSEGKFALTDRHFPLSVDSSANETLTRSLYLRAIMSPQRKISLTPEFRIIDKDRSAEAEEADYLSRSTLFRGTGNIMDLVPGVRHYFHWNGEYERDKFAFARWDAYLNREGYLATEFQPSEWWGKLSFCTFGIAFFQTKKDSLFQVENVWGELWFQDGDYSLVSTSEIYRLTIYPSHRWELSELFDHTRSASSFQRQSQSMVWWRGENAQVIGRFNLTFDSGLIETTTYNPQLEWYRSWGKGVFSRASFSNIYKQTADNDEWYYSPSFYIEKTFGYREASNTIQIRNDINPSYREISGSYSLRQLSLSDALNIDYRGFQKVLLRLAFSFDYDYNLILETDEANYAIKIQSTIKF
jgi:hypothetical protein